MLNYRYIFEIKYTETILLNSTWKLLWFEITKMLNAVLEKNVVIYYNFRHAFVPYNPVNQNETVVAILGA